MIKFAQLVVTSWQLHPNFTFRTEFTPLTSSQLFSTCNLSQQLLSLNNQVCNLTCPIIKFYNKRSSGPNNTKRSNWTYILLALKVGDSDTHYFTLNDQALTIHLIKATDGSTRGHQKNTWEHTGLDTTWKERNVVNCRNNYFL